MPSVKRFLFGKKKNQGPKFQEFHGYDNLRHAYPISPAHHPAPPPHSFSHRQQLYPQQLVHQQVVTQCQCQQCSFQQPHAAIGQQPSQVHIIPQPQPQNQQAQMQIKAQLQCQPQTQQQHQQQQPFNHTTLQHYVSQTTTQVTAPTVVQCTCQHCPYQLQQLQQQQHQQQQHHHQQQQQQLSLNGQQLQMTLAQTDGNTCQHQPNTHQQAVQQPVHQPFHPHPQAVQQLQYGTIHPQPTPNVMQTTPTIQHQIPQQQQPQLQQYQCHTIQPQHYQQQKQLLQQQQYHQRVQSYHHQPPQSNYPPHNQPQLMVQPQNRLQHQEQQVESQSESHDFSRYANMQSLLDDSLHSHAHTNSQSKYQEHVYCNQKVELPPYEPPPDYATFMERKKIYSLELGNQPSYESRSLVWQRAKDSSYENLRSRFSTYTNLALAKEQPGYTLTS